MSRKFMFAIAAVLLASTASAAMADGFDPYLGNRYPAYNEPGASAAVAVHNHGALRTAPVRLEQQSAHIPHAFQEQVQDGYPQSPPSIGGN